MQTRTKATATNKKLDPVASVSPTLPIAAWQVGWAKTELSASLLILFL